LVFNLMPVLFALWISFTRWSILTKPTFIGMENYGSLISDPIFSKSIGNTLFYTATSVPIGLIISLLLAAALNQKIRGLAFFRTSYYLPVISASVAISMVWMWIYASNYGLLNYLMVRLNLTPIDWMNNTTWALPAVILVSIWRGLGFNMIIFLAALQDVPEELYDAARIDGANIIALFRHITLPLITPAIFFTSVMGIIASFQSFDLVYNMRPDHDGGPARATTLIGFYIWQQAFSYLKMGYGSALAFVLFIMILFFTLIQWKVRRWWVFGEE
jgi:multiple sugar transport system permease protein